MTEDEIIKICKQYRIRNYTINPDMSIDVNGDICLQYMSMTQLPLRFNKVFGAFWCSHSGLTTLNGCPNYVGKSFHCHNTQISSIDYCPNYVGGDFSCSECNITTLDGLPINFYIGGDLYCAKTNIKNSRDYTKLFFGTLNHYIFIGEDFGELDKLQQFLNNNKNPPKKDLPKILSELRKIQL